eukprot:3572605-Amphidinium_carterae.1
MKPEVRRKSQPKLTDGLQLLSKSLRWTKKPLQTVSTTYVEYDVQDDSSVSFQSFVKLILTTHIHLILSETKVWGQSIRVVSLGVD